MRRALAAFILVTCITLTNGCWGWGHTEISDLSIVVGIGVDLADDQSGEVECTLQVANSAALVSSQLGGRNEETPYYTISGHGRNVWEALYSIHPQISNRLFYGHTRLYIIGESAARQGVAPYIDGLLRFRDTRANVYLVVAQGQAKQILTGDLPPDNVSSLALSDLFSIQGYSTTLLPVTLNEFYYQLNNRAQTGQFAPAIVAESVTAGGALNSSESATGIRISGLAVFDKDGKMVDYFGEKETRGLMWVLDRVRDQYLTVTLPNQPDQTISLHMVKSKSRITIDLEDNEMPGIEIAVAAKGDLLEFFGVNSEEIPPDFYNNLENAASTTIKQEMLASIKKAQELNVDVFGLGEEFRRLHYPEWEGHWKDRWNEIFPQVNVEISVDTAIRHRGQITTPPGGKGVQ